MSKKMNLDELSIKSFVTKDQLEESKGGAGSIVTTNFFTHWAVCGTGPDVC